MFFRSDQRQTNKRTSEQANKKSTAFAVVIKLMTLPEGSMLLCVEFGQSVLGVNGFDTDRALEVA